MSLGPPFDESGLRRQLQLGSAVLVILVAVIVGILGLSGRTLGRGEHVSVRLKRPGALREGSKLRLAGREIGEVRSLRPDAKGVLVDAFVLREWLPHLHVNSEIFVSSVSILGEAHLEIGPPRSGAALGPVLPLGHEIRGTDPPDLDALLTYTLDNSQEWMKLLGDLRPDAVALLVAGQQLLAHVRALPLDPQTRAGLVSRFVDLFTDARALSAKLDEAGGAKRIFADARAVGSLIDDKSGEVGVILDEARRATDKAEALFALWSGNEMARAGTAWEQLKATGRSVDTIVADLDYLIARVRRGKGTLGGFLTDRELWDDLHESHRQIKQQPWNLLVKPEKKRRK